MCATIPRSEAAQVRRMMLWVVPFSADLFLVLSPASFTVLQVARRQKHASQQVCLWAELSEAAWRLG